jgi:hypothetical protein
LFWVERDIGDPTSHECWTDAPEFDRPYQLRIDPIGECFWSFGSRVLSK